MASGVVKAGRRTYAVGLIWQPSPSGRVAQAAREAAQQPGQQADFYCVRAANKNVAIPQYGLGQAALGHKSGMPTLAASIANAQPGSWAGAFRLREGTWVVVVRDDLVAPDGDILFDNDEAARDRLLQEINLGGVQRIYSPDGWAVPGSDPTPLPLLLQDREECRLQPVRLPIKLLIYGAGAVAVVMLIIFLALQWQAEQERLEMERIQQEMQAKQKAKEQQGPIAKALQKWEWPPAEECYERKWEKKPQPFDVMMICKNALTKSNAMQLGWKRALVVCNNEAVLNVIWNKDNKRGAIVPDKARIRDDINVAEQTIRGQPVTARGPETLISDTQLSSVILYKNWPVTVVRLPDDAPSVSPPPEEKNPPPPPPPPWIKRGIKYSGKAPPWEIWSLFQGTPGFILDRIQWDGTAWAFEATIYEMRGGR